MLPLPNPPKPGGRKSPFADPPDPKRYRVSDSPRPPVNAGYMTAIPRPDVAARYYGSLGMAIDRQHPLPVMMPNPQDLGPHPDANQHLGYAPRQYASYPLLHDHNLGPHLRPVYFIRPDEVAYYDARQPAQMPVMVAQRETPTPTPITMERAIMHGQQPTPPHTDPMRPPQTRPMGYSPSPAHPMRNSSNQHMGPPKTPTPFQPRRFRVPQRELAVQLVEFEDLAAHTAKCDVCDKRNTDGMVRCKPCGWQCCRRCLAERGGDRTHPKAGNLHVPSDAPHVKRPDLNSNSKNSTNITSPMMVTPSPSENHPIVPQRPAPKYVSPEEEAARILVSLKHDSWERVGPRAASAQGAGSDPIRPVNLAGAGSPDLDSEGTEMLPDPGSETECDEENLPDSLVNVRRNPSRKARPAELKE